jgi:pyrroloquinoline quinone biosynthesis protein B
MRVRVLGSAAGGGVPQWNCACDNCALARSGDGRVAPRTQDSLLVQAATGNLLVNASPDVLRQIEATPALQPPARRGTGISAIVLTNGDLDHVLGLFSLRESQRLVVYATERVWSGITANAMARTLMRFDGHVTHRRLSIGAPMLVPEVGVTITAFAAPGKLPVHLMNLEPSAEDNVGLRVEAEGAVVTIATATRDVRAIRDELRGVVFLDGTFYTSDELVTQELGKSRAEDMAHQPVRESIELLEGLAAKRKILTHINNTNPILREGSPEGAWVSEKGWEIAWDGMEIEA